MLRFLAIGHVTRDSRPEGDVLGGSASYAALTAARLGCDVGVLTAAGPDFEPEKELPGISVFVRRNGSGGLHERASVEQHDWILRYSASTRS